MGGFVGGSVRISSNRPDVLMVPADVAVAGLNNPVKFSVNTIPVAAPAEVTISAQVGGGSSVSTASLIVRPPQLAGIDCSPRQLVGGDSTHCKVWLDGRVAGVRSALGTAPRGPAGNPLPVAIGSSDAQVATAPGNIAIAPGQSEAQFDISSTPHPDTIPVTLSASAGGAQRSITLTFTPAAILAFTCKGNRGYGPGYCREIVGSNINQLQLSAELTLTAPAPGGGYPIHLASSSSLLGTAATITVPPAKAMSDPISFQEHAVAVETMVTIAAQDPVSAEKKTVVVYLEPPRPDFLSFNGPDSTVTMGGIPEGGRQLRANLTLDGVTPSQGMKFDVAYSWTDSAGEKLSDADIKGPRSIDVAGGTRFANFTVTIPPCGIHPPCRAVISIQNSSGEASGEVIVNP